MTYQFISHPAYCSCCGGGLIDFVDGDEIKSLSPQDWISQAYMGSDSPVTLLTESDYLNRKQELGLSDQDWHYVSSLFSDPVDWYSFKWGGEIGTAPQLTYSFVDGGPLYFDANYQQDQDGDLGGGYSSQFTNYSETNPMIDFSEAEKEFIRDTLDWFSDASGIEFLEVSDSRDTYGDMRFYLQDFDAWTGFSDDYYAGGFAWLPWGDSWSGGTGNSWALAGDVFLRSDYELYDGYAETVIVHEIGHALGLTHPFDGGYNNIGDSIDSLDNNYTVMTYDQYPSLLGINPLQIDLLAMEFLYGGNEDANLGSDYYDLDTFLFQATDNSGFTDARMSILDYGGQDSINAGDFNNGIFMNLQPGSWSNFYSVAPILVSYGSDGTNTQFASSFDTNTGIDVASDGDILDFGQLYISSNTFIEGCVLTEYDDILFDNEGGNLIECSGGDDQVSSSYGDDYIFGGLGFDHVSLYGSADDYASTYSGVSDDGGGIYRLSNGDRVVDLNSVEEISFFDESGRVTSIFLIENFEGADPGGIDTDPGYSVIDLGFESDHMTTVFNVFNEQKQDWWEGRSTGVYFHNAEGIEETVYFGEVIFASAGFLESGNMVVCYALEGTSGFVEYYYRLYDTESSEFLGEAVQIAPDVNLTAGAEASIYVFEASNKVYFEAYCQEVDGDSFHLHVTMEESGDALLPAWPYNPIVTNSSDPYPNQIIAEDNGGISWFAKPGSEYPITNRDVLDYSYEYLSDGSMIFTYVSNTGGYPQAYYRLFDLDTREFVSDEVELAIPPGMSSVGSLYPWEIIDGVIAFGLSNENYDEYSVGYFEVNGGVLTELQPFSDTFGDYDQQPLAAVVTGDGVVLNALNGDFFPVTYSNDVTASDWRFGDNGDMLISFNKWDDNQQQYMGYYRVFNIFDNEFVTSETLIGEGDYTTIYEITDGRYIFNLERYDDVTGEYIHRSYIVESDGSGFDPIEGQSTILGADTDFFIGDTEADYVETGGGDDQIMSGAGDDYVVVQGAGEVRVDTGAGDDHIVVEDTFSGTVFLKNGAGFNTLELLGDYEDIEATFNNGGMTITNGNNGNVINIEGQHVLNEETGLVEIADTGFQFIKIYGHDTDGNLEDYATYIVAGNDEANYLFAGQPDDAEEQDEVYVYGGAGSDTIDVSAANAVVEGGLGDDVIYIDAVGGEKLVFGDIFNGDNNGISSENISYADVVKIGWSYEDSIIDRTEDEIGYRIENVDLGAVVEVYDVEFLKFLNEDGSWTDKPLTKGAPVDINASYGTGSGIKFVVSDGDTIQVLGAGKKGDTVLWEGNRLEVDAFNFDDGISVNVINIFDEDVFENPIIHTEGTPGVDLIFGNDSDNLIDGKGGDDIIFGGGGNDVIIGGEGDDVITGGAGDDIIRGDGVDVDDAAVAYYEDAGVSGDSLSASDMITDGNDTIIGGDGVDDIESGNGENFVASGRVDLDGDGAADLDLIKDHMTTNQDVFNDDEWV